jgi:S-adenosylmethionine/arginine decarboxylase-like enzyme
MNPDATRLSKSYAFFALLIALFLISAFTPASWFGLETTKKSYTPIDFSQLKTTDQEAYDTDNNGSISWEELTKSNKYGDGILAEAKDTPPSAETLAGLNDPNNLTASLSKNLYSASNQIIAAGGVSAEEQHQILQDLANQESKKIVSKKYLYNEINVAKSEDQDSIRSYGNSIATILQGMITEDTIKKDGDALASFASQQNQEGVSDIVILQEEASRFDVLIKKLLALSVPPSSSFYHIMVVNQMTLYRDTVNNLSQVSSDPVRAHAAIGTYPDTIVATLLMYKKMSDYFTLKNIVFKQNEPGYVFTIGYTLQ